MNNIDMLNLSGRAKTDGLFECKCYTLDKETNTTIEKPFLLMLEAKKDVDFSDLDERAKVLLQAMCYLKLILTKGISTQIDNTVSTKLPDVIVLGSKINCGAIPTSAITRLWNLEKTYIGGVDSPSHAWEPRNKNDGILDILKNNDEINKAFILRDVENGLYDLCSDILHIATETEITEDVSERNIIKAYQRFDIYVLYKKARDGDIIDIPMDLKRKAFLSLILADSDKVTLVETQSAKGPSKPKEIIKINFSGDTLEVNRRQYETFKVLYSLKEYTPKEKEVITAVADRLIKEDSRRFKGDYYTPDIWVEEAYKLIDKHLGKDWREHYLVWDCAWGTGNLTRSQFDYGTDKNLYCSTLREEDINIAIDAGYNPNATKFQYDFLNDDIDIFESLEGLMWEPFRKTVFYTDKQQRENIKQYINLRNIYKLYELAVDKGVINPEEVIEAKNNIESWIGMTKLYQKAPGLVESLLGWNNKEKRKLLFIINPPYATGTDMTNLYSSTTKAKAGVADNMVDSRMRLSGLGCRNLYMQFLWRITRISELLGVPISLGLFSPSSIFTYIENGPVAKRLEDMSAFCDGYLIQGSQFSDVSPTWGISFSLFTDQKKGYTDTVALTVMHTNDKMEAVVDKSDSEDGIKYLTRLGLTKKEAEKINITSWIREPLKGKTTKDTVYLSSGLNVAVNKSTGAYNTGNSMYVDGFLGSMLNGGSKLEENAKSRSLCSAMQNNSKAVNCTIDNFDRIVQLFTIRSIIEPNWKNCKDEIRRPSSDIDSNSQWVNDCIIISIFNSQSNQTSMRNVEFNGKYYNVYNEFFWLSKKEIMALARGDKIPGVYSNKIITDLNTHAEKERYVFTRLDSAILSKDAQDILKLAKALLYGTFKYRDEFNEKNPRYHINTWDAGWYQIKELAKQYFPTEFKAFNELYRNFENRLREQVYSLGFLYR